jgi:hypothetical protein
LTGVANRNLCSHMGAETQLLRRRIRAGCSIKAVAIEQGHCRHLELGRARHQSFGQRCAFEKREGGAGMELDVLHQS